MKYLKGFVPSSCLKLAYNDLFNILNATADTRGTLLYFQVLKMIIVADIEKTTTIVETFLSIEINAHNSLYLILLVKQKQLLPQALNIPIFNSQACESIFRNTRALNGIYSTIFNFTVHDFLRRAQRLSLLNDIKCKQLHNGLVDKLVFPVHYKHRVERQSPFTHSQLKIDEIDIEQVITDAYHHAVDMLEDDEVFESDDDNDEDEDDTTNDLSMNEDNNDSSINKDYTDEDEQNSIQDLLNTTKKDFSGVNTADKVEPHI
ncbi:unnamed protein product [Rotaria magnacalcarata]|uniref:Uncharacterized protein n=1 Tax=Rotaria magnacalcarata TaxID=392030 RepID=A0A820FXK7_9BILA|nr:unnamed protein product [Rotaria magnacalcarata]CAF4270891.1 unnamed protein product [Rotaria magnacalcarata]